MSTYGERMALIQMAQNVEVTVAALEGNREALTVLMSLAAQTGYTDGMSAAAHTVGFPL